MKTYTKKTSESCKTLGSINGFVTSSVVKTIFVWFIFQWTLFIFTIFRSKKLNFCLSAIVRGNFWENREKLSSMIATRCVHGNEVGLKKEISGFCRVTKKNYSYASVWLFHFGQPCLFYSNATLWIQKYYFLDSFTTMQNMVLINNHALTEK